MLTGMAQRGKGDRVLAQARLSRPVCERVVAEARAVFPDKQMKGPLVADLMALWSEMPGEVKDFTDVGALPTSRPVYDALVEEAGRREIPLEQLIACMAAELLERPDLLNVTRAYRNEQDATLAAQGTLPIGNQAAA